MRSGHLLHCIEPNARTHKHLTSTMAIAFRPDTMMLGDSQSQEREEPFQSKLRTQGSTNEAIEQVQTCTPVGTRAAAYKS